MSEASGSNEPRQASGTDEARQVQVGEAVGLDQVGERGLADAPRPDLDRRQRNIKPVRKAAGPPPQRGENSPDTQGSRSPDGPQVSDEPSTDPA